MSKRLQRLPGLLAGLMLAASVHAASAHDYRIGEVTIDHPHTRATPPGAANAAAYARLVNAGSERVVLVGARSDAAERVELHRSIVENGVARMRAVEDGIAVAPGETVELAPRSHHIMLFGLKRPLAEGERVRLVLSFRDEGDIEVELAVHAMTSSGHAHH